MSLIYNVRNGGKGYVNLGQKRVNGYNVYPSTITVTASGVTLTPDYYDNFEFFNLTQTSADTDNLILPDSLPVGAVILLHALTNVEIATETASLNAGGGNDLILIPQYSTAVCTKVASDNIVVHILDDDGTIDIPSLTS